MEGDLASVGVVDLLQMLQLGGKSGALVLTRSLEEVSLWTGRGLLVCVYAPRGEGLSVAWTLHLEGMLSAERLRASREQSAVEERWIAQLAEGRLTHPPLAQALLLKHTSRLLVEVAGWATGHFAFEESGSGVRPPAALAQPLQPASFWLEVLRRRDEVGSVSAECRKRRVVFEVLPGRRSESLSPRARRLLEMIGPRADIDGIFQAFQQARYEALEATRELLGARLVEPRAEDELVKLERTFWNYVPGEDEDEAGFLGSADEDDVDFLVEALTPPPAAPGSRWPVPEAVPSRRLTGIRPASATPGPRPAAGSARPGVPAGAPTPTAASGIRPVDPRLQRQLRALTEGLDDAIPNLPPRELWQRRLTFAAVALVLVLAAAALVAASLGLHRPLLSWLSGGSAP